MPSAIAGSLRSIMSSRAAFLASREVSTEKMKMIKKQAQKDDDLPELITDFEQKFYSDIYKNRLKKDVNGKSVINGASTNINFDTLMKLLSVYSALIYTMVFLYWFTDLPERGVYLHKGFAAFLFLAPVAVYLYIRVFEEMRR